MIVSVKGAPPNRGDRAGRELLDGLGFSDNTAGGMIQGPAWQGMISSRRTWVWNGLADLEFSACSVMLRADHGGAARAILDRTSSFTIAPLREYLDRIDRKLALGKWLEVQATLTDDFSVWLRSYAPPTKHQFNKAEQDAHAALVALANREGGAWPW